MAVYADFTFYDETFLGTAIAEADFTRLALRASEFIDLVTFGRTAAVVAADEDADTIELIQKAACAVAEQIQANEAGHVQSERVGQHSVTYVERPAVSDHARLAAAAKRYLWNTELMFAGITDEDA